MSDSDKIQETQPANGTEWKVLLVRVYGPLGVLAFLCASALAMIWNTQIAPDLEDNRENNRTLREQIPEQTRILREIKDATVAGESTRNTFQQQVSRDHAAQLEALRKLCSEWPQK